MAGDKQTTGSIMGQGLVPGLPDSIMASGTYAITSPTLITVTADPTDSITSVTGSDIAYCVGDGEFYIGDITLGVGGSGWTVMTA